MLALTLLLNSIIIINFPKQTVTANNNHNQAARKSNDQQSWLPMITTKIEREKFICHIKSQ